MSSSPWSITKGLQLTHAHNHHHHCIQGRYHGESHEPAQGIPNSGLQVTSNT